MEARSGSLKRTARLAGLLYLVWIITGLFALMYVPSHIGMKGDAATIAQNVLSNEFLFRTNIVNDLLSSTLWVFLALVLYRLLKPVDERQARLLVAFVIVQIPVAFFMEACNITSLMIFKGEVLTTFDLVQRQDAGVLFLRIGDYGVLTLIMFWGIWLFPLGILVYKSRFLPRVLGGWLIITGFFYVVLSVVSLLFPQYKEAVSHSPIALPIELGEVAFMLWLLIMGAKNQASE